MRIVHDPVKDSVGHGGVPDAAMPGCDRILAGEECRPESMAVLHDVEEISSFVFGQR